MGFKGGAGGTVPHRPALGPHMETDVMPPPRLMLTSLQKTAAETCTWRPTHRTENSSLFPSQLLKNPCFSATLVFFMVFEIRVFIRKGMFLLPLSEQLVTKAEKM